MLNHYRKYVFTTLLLTNVYFAVNAQKFSSVQTTGLFAPANIKVDNKSSLWNEFQAYNKSIGVFYSIANDNENLYLIIRASDPDVIAKIVGGGITFSIYNSENKKSEINNRSVSITFPAYNNYGSFHYINLKNRPKIIKDTLKHQMQNDSFVRAINRQATDLFKEIETTGVQSISDSLISIYNEEGIKAYAAFDAKVNLNYRVYFPIKYFKELLNSSNSFGYRIKLSGATAHNASIRIHGALMDVFYGNRTYFAMPATPQYMSIAYPTEITGEYTLAKKP